MFWSWPLLGPLLVENESSDTRDHCANERSELHLVRNDTLIDHTNEMKSILVLPSALRLHGYRCHSYCAFFSPEVPALAPRAAYGSAARHHLLAVVPCLFDPRVRQLHQYVSLYRFPGRVMYPILMTSVETLDKYSKKVAIVQTGWRTQSVGLATSIRLHSFLVNRMKIMSLVALSIIGTCVILLVITKVQADD